MNVIVNVNVNVNVNVVALVIVAVLVSGNDIVGVADTVNDAQR